MSSGDRVSVVIQGLICHPDKLWAVEGDERTEGPNEAWNHWDVHFCAELQQLSSSGTSVYLRLGIGQFLIER